MPNTVVTGLVCFLALGATGIAQKPSVLLDINQTPSAPLDANPNAFARLGNQVLFAATTPALGTELWSMAVGTGALLLVTDIAPGTPSSSPRELVVFGGYIYFFADDGVHGSELWRSDGTAAGTTLVVDVLAGESSFANGLTVAGNKLFFSAYTTLGNELVVCDGTAAGTQVIDVRPGGHSLPTSLVAIGNEVWFRATTDAHGVEAWRSDGTPGGTTLVADLVAGTSGSFPGGFVAIGGKVLFLANSGLWASDGTAVGTTQLGYANRLSAANGIAWFAGGGSIGSSDGTIGGTQQRFTVTVPPFGQLDRLVAFGSHVMVSITGGLLGGTFHYLSDGTQAGTFQTAMSIGAHVVDGGKLWFAGADANGSELWRTDGTLLGTARVVDAVPGAGGILPQAMVVIGVSDVMFSASAPGLGREPWRSNGTAAGTTMVGNLANEEGNTLDASPSAIVDAAGTAYFSAYDGTVSTLWRTDGTAAGTQVVVPAGPDQPIYIDRLTAVGDKLFFIGNTAATGNEIMVTDGTAAGTHVIDTYPNGSSNPSQLIAAQDRLYFLSYNPFGGRSLWQTNGTTSVAITAQISPGTIGWMTAFGRGLVFGYNNPLLGVGEEPWFTDGSVAGTFALGDLLPGLSSSEPAYISVLGDRCFFTARTVLGFEKKLFVTDGTLAGTSEFFAGVVGAPTFVERLAVVRDQLFFNASDPVNGHELWVTDGTVAGTHVVLDTVPGTSGMTLYEPAPFGDLLLYYLSGPGITGTWRSDGTAAGTFRLTDRVGVGKVAAGERTAWFRALDEAGEELWSTDGTVAGTSRHSDLLSGDASSQPTGIALSRGRLLFAARDEQLGRELWTLDLDATSQPVGYGCAANALPSRLWCDDPVLGSTMTFEVRGGPPSGLSVPLFTNHVTCHRPLGPSGCDLFLEVGSLVMDVQVFQGGATQHQLAVPVSPALNGLLFRVQVLTLSGASVLELGLSNAVTMALGH